MNNELLDTCGCCEGIKAQTPAALDNPPGLSVLAYRIGTHGQFKESMLAAISGRRELDGLTSRADDDPSIALLDGWATLLDVLSFYQERIVNECYLRTANERRSILELARSIGYELRPGVAAGVYLAFSLEDVPQAPREATIPLGAKVQSIPEQDEKPQTFETAEELSARAEWSSMRPRLRELKLPGFGDTQVALKGTSTNLKPGDAILFVGEEREKNQAVENWDFRRVAKIEPVFTGNADTDYTLVIWDRPLGKINPYGPVASVPRVFALRQRASLFGFNAPDWRTLTAKTQRNFVSSDSSDWPGFNLFDLVKRQGLFGEYFANADLTGDKQTRLDDSVDIRRPVEGTCQEMMAGSHSARWTGLVEVPASDTWTFSIDTDCAVRLWVDDTMVIDAWRSKPPTGIVSGKIYLAADGPHDIRLEYSQRATTPMVQLLWASHRIKQQTVSSEYLRPPDVHLDATYPKIQSGGWLVISQPSYQELYRVEDAVEDFQANFMLTAKTTRLTLSGEKLSLFNDQLRGAAVFAESEELFITEQPRTDAVFGQEIELDYPITPLERGRKIIVSGQRVYAKAKNHVQFEIARAKSAERADGILLAKSGGQSFVEKQSGHPKKSLSLKPGQIIRITGEPLVKGAGHFAWNIIDEAGSIGSVTLSSALLELVKEEATTCELVEIDSVCPRADGRTTLVLKEPLQSSYARESVRIQGNIAFATHGESKSEVLGSGDAGQTFQRFTLKQAPLTFVSAPSVSGAESTLQVHVNDVLWREAPSFYGLGPHDRCYVVRRADDGKVTVEFGDGFTGTRPPTGVENIRASYRIGLGLEGNLKADQLNLLLTRPLGVKGVTNRLPSTGGDDPEARDAARQNAPLTVLTLDRIVSLQDFEDFARAFAGIGKAQATWVWSGTQRVVFITVAGVKGVTLIETQSPLINLCPAIDAARETTQPVQVGVCTRLQFRLSAKVLVEDGYLGGKVHAAITSALLDKFSFDQRNFGQAVTASEVMAVMQAVEGVKAIDLDTLHLVGKAPKWNPRLPANIAHWDEQEQRVLPAELLTIDVIGIELTEMKP